MLGIIGGTGLYDLQALSRPKWKRVDSPFGAASDELLFGDLGGQPVVFLPRHGRVHRIAASDVNYRANIDCLKRAGVTQVISVSAVGSLREELSPGTFVLVDQFVDRTAGRQSSFFGTGFVAHVSLARPVCSRLVEALRSAAEGALIPHVARGTYLAMEGPQFSTLAESKVYRSWDCDVLGMTNIPEAKLAREAELCYASVAMVTDYDSWHPEHGHVTAQLIVSRLRENVERARHLLTRVVASVGPFDGSCSQGCSTALDAAVMTPPEHRDAEMVRRLRAVAGRLLRREGI